MSSFTYYILMCCSCCWIEEGADSEAFKLHKAKVRDFMWVNHQGMMMTGEDTFRLVSI